MGSCSNDCQEKVTLSLCQWVNYTHLHTPHRRGWSSLPRITFAVENDVCVDEIHPL